MALEITVTCYIYCKLLTEFPWPNHLHPLMCYVNKQKGISYVMYLFFYVLLRSYHGTSLYTVFVHVLLISYNGTSEYIVLSMSYWLAIAVLQNIIVLSMSYWLAIAVLQNILYYLCLTG